MPNTFNPDAVTVITGNIKTQRKPSEAYRDVVGIINEAINGNHALVVRLPVAGKVLNYDLSVLEERALFELLVEAQYGGCMKESEPEGWCIYQLAQKALGAAMPKMVITPQNGQEFLTWRDLRDPKPNDLLHTKHHDQQAVEYYEARTEVRARIMKSIIKKRAPELQQAYENTFEQCTGDVNPVYLNRFEFLLACLADNLRLSLVDRDDLRFWLFQSADAPYGACPDGLKTRIIELLRGL